MRPYRGTFTVLSLGLGGLSAQTGERGVSISIPDRRLVCYYGDLAEGGIVLDKRRVLEEDPSLAFRSPILASHLPPGTIEPPGQPDRVLAQGMLGMFGEAHAALITATAEPEGYNGLALVATDVYVQFWRRHGARVGQRAGAQVLWEDGRAEPIPSAEERYKDASGRIREATPPPPLARSV